MDPSSPDITTILDLEKFKPICDLYKSLQKEKAEKAILHEEASLKIRQIIHKEENIKSYEQKINELIKSFIKEGDKKSLVIPYEILEIFKVFTKERNTSLNINFPIEPASPLVGPSPLLYSSGIGPDQFSSTSYEPPYKHDTTSYSLYGDSRAQQLPPYLSGLGVSPRLTNGHDDTSRELDPYASISPPPMIDSVVGPIAGGGVGIASYADAEDEHAYEDEHAHEDEPDDSTESEATKEDSKPIVNEYERALSKSIEEVHSMASNTSMSSMASMSSMPSMPSMASKASKKKILVVYGRQENSDSNRVIKSLATNECEDEDDAKALLNPYNALDNDIIFDKYPTAKIAALELLNNHKYKGYMHVFVSGAPYIESGKKVLSKNKKYTISQKNGDGSCFSVKSFDNETFAGYYRPVINREGRQENIFLGIYYIVNIHTPK